MPGITEFLGSRLRPARQNALFSMPAGYLCFILSAVLVTLYNIPFWKALIATQGGPGLRNTLFLISFWILLTALLNVLLNIFCLQFVMRPIAILIVVSSSIALYFIQAYGVMIDPSMIENVAETDIREIRDLLNPGIFTFVILTGLLPALVIARIRIVYKGFIRQLALNLLNIAASLVVAAIILFSCYEDYASLSQNHRYLRSMLVPSSYLHSTAAYFGKRLKATGPLIPVGADAAKAVSWTMHRRRSVTILVIGETARAKNFGLYGYTRDTTPQLARENIIAFENFHACGTSTAISLPCMFSVLTRAGFGKAKALSRENILDVIARSGMRVIWRDNNSGCKGVCDRVEYKDLSRHEGCDGGECYDEILLEGLEVIIDRAERDLFIVLHQKGSHGPAYYKRVPEAFRRFTPVCNDGELKNCPGSDIVNAYDNTILYTDHVLARIIGLLQNRESRYDTALLYVSDHGESLGEKNLYLHGTPYLLAPEEQIHIPFLLWLSPAYAEDFGIDAQCLRQKTAEPYSHDNLFHSLLGMLDIATADYKKSLDIFADCHQRNPGIKVTAATAVAEWTRNP